MLKIIIFVVVIFLAIRKWIKVKDPFLLYALIMGIPIFIMKQLNLPFEFSMMCMAFGGGIALLVYFLQKRKEKFLCAFALLFFTLGIFLFIQTVVAMGHQETLTHFLLKFSK